MSRVELRYWAAARAAAGVAADVFDDPDLGGGRGTTTLAAVLAAAARRRGPELAHVLTYCSFLIGEQPVGQRDPAAVAVADGVVIEALPPFAGG